MELPYYNTKALDFGDKISCVADDLTARAVDHLEAVRRPLVPYVLGPSHDHAAFTLMP